MLGRAGMNRLLSHALGKPSLLALGVLPFCWLFYAAWSNQLGANPAEHLIRSTGDWTLRFLCLTLLVTPLRQVAGWPALARYRRMLGLFVYFYATLHLLGYAWFDMGLDAADIGADIVKRPFILVGFTAFLLLTALASTSTNRAVRWLGARRWQVLHRLVYLIAALALLHFFWMRTGKQDFGEVLVYGSILGALIGWRAWRRLVVSRKGRGTALAANATDGKGSTGTSSPMASRVSASH
jgi:sulfoxide reductase heme-binding subunit YedZ